MSYCLLSERVRVARKAHKCIWCRESIEPGQRYVDERGIYDAAIQHLHWHPECRDAAIKFFRESGEEEFQAHSCKRGSGEEA